jgi:hypothetical protein
VPTAATKPLEIMTMTEAIKIEIPSDAAGRHERVVTLLRNRITMADKIILLLASGDDADRLDGAHLARRYMTKYADDEAQRAHEGEG